MTPASKFLTKAFQVIAAQFHVSVSGMAASLRHAAVGTSCTFFLRGAAQRVAWPSAAARQRRWSSDAAAACAPRPAAQLGSDRGALLHPTVGFSSVNVLGTLRQNALRYPSI